jgi:ABC-type lipoprotein release transport system permease subunit
LPTHFRRSADERFRDPAVFVLTAATLLLVAFVACYVPALQASRTDPLVVLSTE